MNNSVVTGLHTHNGRIFVYHKPAVNAPPELQSLKTEMNTEEKLMDFCSNFVKKSMENIMEEAKQSQRQRPSSSPATSSGAAAAQGSPASSATASTGETAAP